MPANSEPALLFTLGAPMPPGGGGAGCSRGLELASRCQPGCPEPACSRHSDALQLPVLPVHQATGCVSRPTVEAIDATSARFPEWKPGCQMHAQAGSCYCPPASDEAANVFYQDHVFGVATPPRDAAMPRLGGRGVATALPWPRLDSGAYSAYSSPATLVVPVGAAAPASTFPLALPQATTTQQHASTTAQLPPSTHQQVRKRSMEGMEQPLLPPSCMLASGSTVSLSRGTCNEPAAKRSRLGTGGGAAPCVMPHGESCLDAALATWLSPGGASMPPSRAPGLGLSLPTHWSASAPVPPQYLNVSFQPPSFPVPCAPSSTYSIAPPAQQQQPWALLPHAQPQQPFNPAHAHAHQGHGAQPLHECSAPLLVSSHPAGALLPLPVSISEPLPMLAPMRTPSPPVQHRPPMLLQVPVMPLLAPVVAAQDVLSAAFNWLGFQHSGTMSLALHCLGRLDAAGALASQSPLSRAHRMVVLLWQAAKLEEKRFGLAGSSRVAACIGLTPRGVCDIELELLGLLEWSPYRGFQEDNILVLL